MCIYHKEIYIYNSQTLYYMNINLQLEYIKLNHEIQTLKNSMTSELLFYYIKCV